MCKGRFNREGRPHDVVDDDDDEDDCLEKTDASAEDEKSAKASDADIKHLLLTGEYFMVLVVMSILYQ